MDRPGTPRSVLNLPVQVSDDGSVTVVSTESGIGRSALGAPSSSIGPRNTSKPKEGTVHMLQLLCACEKDGVAINGDAPPPREKYGFAEKGDNNDVEFPPECEAEAAAACVSSLTDPAKALVDDFRFEPCAVSGVRIKESVASVAAPAEAPAEPSPPPAPVMTGESPLRAIDVVFHNDDDNRHFEEQIEGRDGGLWDFAVSDDDSELDGEEEEAVRQDSCVAPWDSGEASAAAAAAGVGLQLRRMIGEKTSMNIDVYVEEHTDVLTRREESPSLPAPDDASATGRTYDDITRSPPPHLRCVVSPLPSLPPVLLCTAASPPCFLSPTSRGRGGFRPCSLRDCHSVVWCLMSERVPLDDRCQLGTRG